MGGVGVASLELGRELGDLELLAAEVRRDTECELVGARGRLPFVYGEHDYNRREELVLRRIRTGRLRMPIGPGGFLGSRGYAPELARGLRLTLTGDVSQHLLADASKASNRLGWVHRSPEVCLARSIAWHLAHPPEAPDDDFDADDRALDQAPSAPV